MMPLHYMRLASFLMSSPNEASQAKSVTLKCRSGNWSEKSCHSWNRATILAGTRLCPAISRVVSQPNECTRERHPRSRVRMWGVPAFASLKCRGNALRCALQVRQRPFQSTGWAATCLSSPSVTAYACDTQFRIKNEPHGHVLLHETPARYSQRPNKLAERGFDPRTFGL